MANVYFICGFIGSGKTTFSKKLAVEQSAYRFNADEWMIPLFGEHMECEIFGARLTKIRKLFNASAIQLIKLGVSVIFDYGYWNKRDRLQAIKWAQKHQFSYEVIYLDVSYQICCERAFIRNQGLGGQAYEMTPDMLELFWSKF